MSSGGRPPCVVPSFGSCSESTVTLSAPRRSGSASWSARVASRLPVHATTTRFPTSENRPAEGTISTGLPDPAITSSTSPSGTGASSPCRCPRITRSTWRQQTATQPTSSEYSVGSSCQNREGTPAHAASNFARASAAALATFSGARRPRRLEPSVALSAKRPVRRAPNRRASATAMPSRSATRGLESRCTSRSFGSMRIPPGASRHGLAAQPDGAGPVPHKNTPCGSTCPTVAERSPSRCRCSRTRGPRSPRRCGRRSARARSPRKRARASRETRPAPRPGTRGGFRLRRGPVTRKRATPAEQEDAQALLDPADVDRALAVLARVAQDRGALSRVDAATREALQKLAGEVARPDGRQRKKLRKALRKGERVARKEQDGALRKGTGIQRLRGAAVFRTPLPALPRGGEDASRWWPELPPHDAPPPAAAPAEGDGPELAEPRKCYVCKVEYRRLHPFYDQLCRACAEENQARRTATADLRGRVALVTGARVKIGYQAAILLLRAGCRVVALTRFPRDAAARYAREPDFAAWRDRLTVHGIDLRHTPSVELICQRLEATLPRLDFQVHNA